MSDVLVPLATDPSVIEAAADPGQFVVLACERAKTWLTQAVEHGEIDQLVEMKSQAEAIRVYTTQKQLGHDAELAAAEIVRRADRGIGLAIRRGQEEGTIRRKGQHIGNQHGNRSDKKSSILPPPPTEFASGSELSGNEAGIYHMTDGVSDDEFEDAITQAKAEGNLSRANVVRKLKPNGIRKTRDAVRDRERRLVDLAIEGHNSSQIADELGLSEGTVKNIARRLDVEIPADKLIGRARRIDPNRVIEETVLGLDAQASALSLMDGRWAAVDADRVDGWVSSLTDSLRLLNRFCKQLKELTHDQD